MARYIDADKFREDAFYADTEADINNYIRLYGYADVVPKSEVEEWKAEAIHYQGLWCQTEIELDQAKQEVAREIFEEIEDVLNNLGFFDEIDFKQLKKKYTESEDK